MKKIAIILVILCSFINIYGQKECCYSSKFLKLYSTNYSLYFVQTRNSEQMMKIKEMVSRSNDGEKIIASLAENAIIITEGQARCEVLTEKVIVR